MRELAVGQRHEQGHHRSQMQGERQGQELGLSQEQNGEAGRADEKQERDEAAVHPALIAVAMLRVAPEVQPQEARRSHNQPGAAESAEHWLQRYRQRLPAPGLLGVFNRSYYEGLVSDLQDGLCPDAALASRRAEVATLETQLGQRRIHLLKCYLQLSRGEQRLRLERRLELPSKRWKLSRADLEAHRQFDSLQARWASELAASHSSAAPWYVIPADHRWQRDLLVASLLARTLERLQLDWPAQPAPFSLAELQACAG